MIDPGRLSAELGGGQEFGRLAGAARDAGLGVDPRRGPEPHGGESTRTATGPTRSCARRFFDIDPATGRHRRFFDIDDLAGVRQEDPDGVRGDARAGPVARPRGPGRRAAGRPSRRARRPGRVPRAAARPAASSGSGSRRSSTPDERLRDWPVCGTVGYEFLNDVCALFVDPAGEAALTALWRAGLGRRAAL